MKYESFNYTPIELAEFSTRTVQDTLAYLYRKNYITEKEYNHLSGTLAVYAMPNRKGFGRKLLERFFGTNENEDAFVFPIIEIDSAYNNSKPKSKKPALNVVEGDFGKDKQ